MSSSTSFLAYSLYYVNIRSTLWQKLNGFSRCTGLLLTIRNAKRKKSYPVIYTRRQKTWALGDKMLNKKTIERKKQLHLAYIITKTSNGLSSLLLADLSQPLGHGGQQLLDFCTPLHCQCAVKLIRLNMSLSSEFFIYNGQFLYTTSIL